MDSVRVFHTGDLHLGFEFSGTESISRQRYLDNMDTFGYIIDVCNSKDVDFLLIAGDLFETDTPSKKIVDKVIEEINKLNNTYVIIAPGNHDCYNENGIYGQAELWGDHVYIFTGEMDYFEFNIRHTKVRIHGAAFTSRYQKQSLMIDRRITKDSTINIGLFHGELMKNSGMSNYNPIRLSQINNNRFDYLALGHIHQHTKVKKADYGMYAYCGCPEGHGFDETGVKGAYLGEVFQGGASMKFIRTSKRIYATIKIVLDETLQTEKDVQKSIVKLMKGRYYDEYSEFIYRLDVYGNNPNHINIDRLKQLFSDIFYVDIVNYTKDISMDYQEEKRQVTRNLNVDRSVFEEPHPIIDTSLQARYTENIRNAIKMEQAKSNCNEILVERYEQALKIGLEAIENNTR